jgi:hypothetical protein
MTSSNAQQSSATDSNTTFEITIEGDTATSPPEPSWVRLISMKESDDIIKQRKKEEKLKKKLLKLKGM